MSSNEVYRIENNGDRVRLVTRDWTATLIKRDAGKSSEYYKLTRVYGAVDTFAPAELKQYNDAVLADPDTNHRASRRVATSRARAGLLEALDAIAEHLGFDVNFRDLDGTVYPRAGAFKVSFNGKAGCSCGCSPGFIVDDALRIHGTYVDVWFSSTYEDSLTRAERAKREQARRDAMVITPSDRAQAVFYGLTELDKIKQELGV